MSRQFDDEIPTGRSFRDSASFGKRIEYWVIGLLLKQGFDVFVPLVDDDGIDAILRHPNGRKVDIQIKARSSEVKFGSAALFAGLDHREVRNSYFFVFYSERLDLIWLMSSADFVAQAYQNGTGINAGKKSLNFSGKSTKRNQEYRHARFDPWCITLDGNHDFSRLHDYLQSGPA